MRKFLRPAMLLLGILTVLTGVIYPAAITILAQMVFPVQANGSLLKENGRVIGSELIGQPFQDPKYFWGRPSATSPYAYNGGASSGSNLGPSNPALHRAVADRVAALHQADPDNREPVPVDLVTASGSGLDPHVSPAAARYQAKRISRVRGIPLDQVLRLIGQATEARTLGVWGEPRVHLLRLNLLLDALIDD